MGTSSSRELGAAALAPATDPLTTRLESALHTRVEEAVDGVCSDFRDELSRVSQPRPKPPDLAPFRASCEKLVRYIAANLDTPPHFAEKMEHIVLACERGASESELNAVVTEDLWLRRRSSRVVDHEDHKGRENHDARPFNGPENDPTDPTTECDDSVDDSTADVEFSAVTTRCSRDGSSDGEWSPRSHERHGSQDAGLAKRPDDDTSDATDPTAPCANCADDFEVDVHIDNSAVAKGDMPAARTESTAMASVNSRTSPAYTATRTPPLPSQAELPQGSPSASSDAVAIGDVSAIVDSSLRVGTSTWPIAGPVTSDPAAALTRTWRTRKRLSTHSRPETAKKPSSSKRQRVASAPESQSATNELKVAVQAKESEQRPKPVSQARERHEDEDMGPATIDRTMHKVLRDLTAGEKTHGMATAMLAFQETASQLVRSSTTAAHPVDSIAGLCCPDGRTLAQTAAFKRHLRETIPFVDATLCKPPPGQVCSLDCKKVRIQLCNRGEPCLNPVCRTWHDAETHIDRCDDPRCEFKARVMLREVRHQVERGQLLVRKTQTKLEAKRTALAELRTANRSSASRTALLRTHEVRAVAAGLQSKIDALVHKLARDKEQLTGLGETEKELRATLGGMDIQDSDDEKDGFPDFASHYQSKGKKAAKTTEVA